MKVKDLFLIMGLVAVPLFFIIPWSWVFIPFGCFFLAALYPLLEPVIDWLEKKISVKEE